MEDALELSLNTNYLSELVSNFEPMVRQLLQKLWEPPKQGASRVARARAELMGAPAPILA